MRWAGSASSSSAIGLPAERRVTMAFVLILCGTTAAVIGVYRSFVLAREALAPLVHDGEPTRTALEDARPIHERPRVRRMAALVATSVGWLVVAMYGLFLVVRASEISPA